MVDNLGITDDMLEIPEGRTWPVEFTFRRGTKNPDGTITYTPVDLTGKVVRAIVKRPKASDAAAIISYRSDDATPHITITDAAAGKATVAFQASDTQEHGGDWFLVLDVLTDGDPSPYRAGPLRIRDL